MFDLDQEVANAHQSVTETESQARAIEARIRKIDGAGPLLPARGYGRPVDTAAISKGLTLRSLIAVKDPQLASYLGISFGLCPNSLTSSRGSQLWFCQFETSGALPESPAPHGSSGKLMPSASYSSKMFSAQPRGLFWFDKGCASSSRNRC